jgi:hypothetical protein
MFTKEEVEKILVAVQVFSGANHDQGLKGIKGESYGEKASTIINAFHEAKGNENTILKMIEKFR